MKRFGWVLLAVAWALFIAAFDTWWALVAAGLAYLAAGVLAEAYAPEVDVDLTP